MNFEKKYLKYKNKYISLKKHLGGFRNTYNYMKVVPEFLPDTTNIGFSNDTPRTLNSITITGVDDHSNDYEETRRNILQNEAKIINKDDHIVKDFIALLKQKSREIIELKGFYNKSIDYKTNTTNGTYVKQTDFNEVFKQEKIQSISVSDKDKIGKVFDSSKGIGKKNLHNVMTEYKGKNIKYVFFDVAGTIDGGLVSLYKHYGFVVLMDKYNFYFTGDNGKIESFPSYNVIMFGNIDDIIRRTS